MQAGGHTFAGHPSENHIYHFFEEERYIENFMWEKMNVLGFLPARKLGICYVKWVLLACLSQTAKCSREELSVANLPVKILFQLLSLRSSFLLKFKVYLRISDPASRASLLPDSL